MTGWVGAGSTKNEGWGRKKTNVGGTVLTGTRELVLDSENDCWAIVAGVGSHFGRAGIGT